MSYGITTYKTANAMVTGTGTNFLTDFVPGDRMFNSSGTYLGTVKSILSASLLTLNAVDAVSVTAAAYTGTSATITGTGTNFSGLTVGDLLVSNDITLGIIASITNANSLELTTKAGGSVSSLAYKTTAGTIDFSTFYASTSVFVNTWYDQSGNGRDAKQMAKDNQARIVSSGVLYNVNGRTSMEFSNALKGYFQTSAVASYLNNTLYTFNKVSAEATIYPNLQLPISTTGGNGPFNTVAHYGYRNSSQFTVAQYSNDHNFNATPSTSLELHTAVKNTIASTEFFKNGISLGVLSTGGAASYLNNVGILSIGYYTPTFSYYNGSVSELTIFSTALNLTNTSLLNNNQLNYYNIASVTWTGNQSTSWADSRNWSTGMVPTISTPDIVVIPTGRINYPIISGISAANSISLEAGTSLTVIGTLQLAGTIVNLGTCTANAGTIQYSGSASQSITLNTFVGNTVENLIINNPAGVALAGNFTVSGNLTFTSGTLSIGTFLLKIGGTVTNTVAGGLKGGPNSSLVINGTSSPILSFDQTTPGTTNAIRNLLINSSGQTATMANNLVLGLSGTLSLNAGKLAIGGNTLTIRGNIVNSVSEGLIGSATSNLILSGAASPTLSFDQTVTGSTNSLQTLTVNSNGQTVMIDKDMVIVSALNISSGTFYDGGKQIISNGTLNLINGKFKLGSPTVATTWPAFTTNNISTGTTVEYASGVAQIASGNPIYQNLTISATGGVTANNDLEVEVVLSLTASNPSATNGSLSMSTYTLDMGATATTIGIGDVTGIIRRTTFVPGTKYTLGNEFSSITFPATGTLPSELSMKISIGTAPSWQPLGVLRTYDVKQTGGFGTKAVINVHYLDSELNGNAENKLVNFSYRTANSAIIEHGKSNFNTTQKWVALSNVNVSFFPSTFGDLMFSLKESSITTLTWNGSVDNIWNQSGNWTPTGGPSTNTILIIPDAATTPNDPTIPFSVSNGSLTIESGGIVNADPGAQLTLNNSGLAWSNIAGTFNANTSTIIFSNANATINGTTNFYNFTIGTGAGLLLTTGTNMRIAGVLSNNGTFSAALLKNTVQYNGLNQSIVMPLSSYQNLIISGTGTTVLPSNLNIQGDLTINGAVSTIGSTVGMIGNAPQNINGSAALAINNLTVNNDSGIALNQNLTIAGTLTFTAGKLAICNHTLTLSGGIVNAITDGITGGSGSNLVINGSVSPTLRFDQSIPGTTNLLNNLTISSSGQVPQLGSDLTIGNILKFTAGKLALNGNSLRLAGDVVNTVSGGLRGSNASKLSIVGGTESPVLSFDQSTPGTSNLLNAFTINSTEQDAILDNPLIIGTSLNLLSGRITSTTANSLTLATAAVYTGGSDSSFINGPMIRNTNADVAYTFPIGKLNLYHPVGITPAIAASGTYIAEYFQSTPPAGSNQAGLTSIADNEYWNITKTTGPDANVTLTYTGVTTWNPNTPAATDRIIAVQNTGGIWASVNGNSIPGNTGNGLTPVSTRLLSSFSSFTFGFGQGIYLPISLVDFSGAKANQVVELQWKTGYEASFSGFYLERSSDGSDFSNIAWISATNSRSGSHYNHTDNSPINGTNFYRLKMVEKDASFRYSTVVRVHMNSDKSIIVYPNPVIGDLISLQMRGQLKGDYSINIYQRDGSKVMSTILAHDGTNATKTISLNGNVANGYYIFEIIDTEKQRDVRSLLIEK